jgi:L-lactate dehydrogenase (cytochrome)
MKRPSALDRTSNKKSKSGTDPVLMQRYPVFSDMVAAAEYRIPKRIAGYLLGGADSETGLNENLAGFKRIRLTPRYGLPVDTVSTRTELFGRSWAAPIGVAPVGYTSAIWPGCEMALAKAAEQHGLPYITSTYAIEPLEAIAQTAPTCSWFQLYFFQSMDTTLDLVARARKAGFQTLVVTIDIPAYSKRTRDYRNRLEFPPKVSPSLIWETVQCPAWLWEFLKMDYPVAGNLMPYARNPKGGVAAMRELFAATPVHSMDWEELKRIRAAWSGTMVLKGVQHVGDAEAALALGADGIIVSNHGGRQLDAAPAPIDSLPAIADAVGGRLTVMMDSGVRSGLDVAKAIVRGARFCFAGRAFASACCALGLEGADHAMRLFQDEVQTAFGQLGVTSADQIFNDRSREFR